MSFWSSRGAKIINDCKQSKKQQAEDADVSSQHVMSETLKDSAGFSAVCINSL